MGKLGTGELLVILIVALVIFGPSKLPALGKMAGKALGSFRHYVDSAVVWDLEEELSKPAEAKSAAPSPESPVTEPVKAEADPPDAKQEAAAIQAAG